MRVQCRIIVLLFVAVCGFAFSAPAQTKNDDHVTPAEKKEIQRIAKRFVKRYQRTRAIRPLIPEFFIDDLAPCVQDFYVRHLEDKSKNELSASDFLRTYTASMDFLYIEMAVFTYDYDSGNGDLASLASVFPLRLAQDFHSFTDNADFLGDKDVADRKLYMKKLVKWERTISKARRYIARINIEGSPKYLKEFKYYETSDWLGYIVKSRIEDETPYCQRVPAAACPGLSLIYR